MKGRDDECNLLRNCTKLEIMKFSKKYILFFKK